MSATASARIKANRVRELANQIEQQMSRLQPTTPEAGGDPELFRIWTEGMELCGEQFSQVIELLGMLSE